MLLMLVLAGCGGRPEQSAIQSDQAQEPPSTSAGLAVDGYEITYGSIAEPIEASGTTAGIREADITSETQGVIREMLFDLGTAVRAGDPLLRFNDQAEAAALRQAEQQLDAARLEYEAAQRRYERGSSSQAELTQSRAAMAGAESAREQARRVYENRTVRSPIDGYIADYAAGISVGNSLSPGARVARVVNTARLQMRVGVGERSVARIAPGFRAEIFLPSIGSEPYPGQVRSIGAGTDAATGSFPVIVEWDNPADRASGQPPARSGIAGTVRIYNGNENQRLIIPSAALHGPENNQVFIANNGTAQLRQVSVLERRGPRAAVNSGVEQNEVVITSGISSLEDGSRVNVTLRGSSADIQ